ncbi:MAG: large subunit ribosomal protein L28 [Limisphaerales bacterium]|jgi:large subunit ribosomal protein L28
MARVCELTGKKTISGNNVSHSHTKTKRKFYPNLQKKKFWLEDESRWVTLKVTTKAIRTITKKGLSAYIRDLNKKGANIKV